jgi:hypothetical protein
MRFCSQLDAWESALKLKRRPDSDSDREGPNANKKLKTVLTEDDGDPTGMPSLGVTPEDLPEAPAESAPLTSVSRSGRTQRAPRALKDFLPHSLVGLASHLRPVIPAPKSIIPPVRMPSESPEPSAMPSDPPPDTVITTVPNRFGLYREYTTRPRRDPEGCEIPVDLIDPAEPPSIAPITTPEIHAEGNYYDPFPNSTIYRLLDWYHQGSSMKTLADLDRLVKNVILSPDFDAHHLRGFRSSKEITCIDTHDAPGLSFSTADGWKETSVIVNVPNAKHRHPSESAALEFKIAGVHYRPLLEIIKSICQGMRTQNYHWVPHKLFHHTAQGDVHVYSDIYNLDAMLEEHARLRALPCNPEDDPEIETAIMAILLWSDSTHLTSFGDASLWPIYMFFGNVSKYIRGKPAAFPAQHVAYIPSVSTEQDLTP